MFVSSTCKRREERNCLWVHSLFAELLPAPAFGLSNQSFKSPSTFHHACMVSGGGGLTLYVLCCPKESV